MLSHWNVITFRNKLAPTPESKEKVILARSRLAGGLWTPHWGGLNRCHICPLATRREWPLPGSQAFRESPGLLVGVWNLSWLPLWVKMGGLERLCKTCSLTHSASLLSLWACRCLRGEPGLPEALQLSEWLLREPESGNQIWARTERRGSKHLWRPYLDNKLVSSQPGDPSPDFVTLLPFSYTQNTLLTRGYTRHQQGQNIITSY